MHNIRTIKPLATAILACMLIFGPVGTVADVVVLETAETIQASRIGSAHGASAAIMSDAIDSAIMSDAISPNTVTPVASDSIPGPEDIARSANDAATVDPSPTLSASPEAPTIVPTASQAPHLATPTPKSATPTPKSATPTPKSATPTPKPAAPTPKPTPKPATPTPKPATPTPKPATPTPKPAAPTPKPATPTPKPVVTATPTAAPATTGTTSGAVSASGIKNVILMIADGWGYNQILATNHYLAGQAVAQSYERFPVKLAMSTYSIGDVTKADDSLSIYSPSMWLDFAAFRMNPTDSAAAATAISTGFKTYDSAIGLNQDLKPLRHITADFESKGRATGVVTSVPISHATPAGFVAHNASRSNYASIAREMLNSSATDVIMGTGHPLYDNGGRPRSSILDKHYNYVGGKATWDALLSGTLATADANGDGIRDPWTLVQSKSGFEALQTGSAPNRVLGIPKVHSTLQEGRYGDTKAAAYAVPFLSGVPSLKVMTRGALNVLDNDRDGFFLMIEGGAIDWAGHGNQSGRLIEELAAFNAAVDAVCAWVAQNSNWNETLLVVTGDHETGYLTGTSGVYNAIKGNGKGAMPTMAWNSTGHTNQLVPFFAMGKGADLFSGMADKQDTVRGRYLDNTEISKVIRTLLK